LKIYINPNINITTETIKLNAV